MDCRKAAREWQARLKRFDSAQLPIAEEARKPRICVGGVAARERKIIGRLNDGGVAHIERSSTVIGLWLQRIGNERGRVGATLVFMLSPSSSVFENVYTREIANRARGGDSRPLQGRGKN